MVFEKRAQIPGPVCNLRMRGKTRHGLTQREPNPNQSVGLLGTSGQTRMAWPHRQVRTSAGHLLFVVCI